MEKHKPYGVYDILHMEHASFAFNATMLFCIVLVSISITRGWLYLIGKYREITKPAYLAWSIGEVLVASLFMSMYIVLMEKEPVSFFELAGSSFVTMLAICIYPYGFLWLGLELYAKNNEESDKAEDTSLIRFYDDVRCLGKVIGKVREEFCKLFYSSFFKSHIVC